MNTKTLGILLVVIGIIMILYTGFNYITTEEVVDLGPIQLNVKKSHPVQWSPIVGAILLVGGVFVMISNKKNRS
ncbi:hypothetical protein [Flavobacterium sp.]|jgi:uncharacterized membrane protein YdcZ (DUF606 family)|uniref:hypothetical protein n=1 Tax=Flavobacterium sp. TaxID=239 RepID=UPI002A83A304|nr:hypothetical protein [Flavobacterium sp.]